MVNALFYLFVVGEASRLVVKLQKFLPMVCQSFQLYPLRMIQEEQVDSLVDRCQFYFLVEGWKLKTVVGRDDEGRQPAFCHFYAEFLYDGRAADSLQQKVVAA